jgi:hypothetical protein
MAVSRIVVRRGQRFVIFAAAGEVDQVARS